MSESFCTKIVPFYAYGLKGIFHKLYEDTTDNRRVVEVTRFSLQSLLDINSTWDVEILKFNYSLGISYAASEDAKGCQKQQRNKDHGNEQLLCHGPYAKKEIHQKMPVLFDWNPCGMPDDKIAKLPLPKDVQLVELHDEEIPASQHAYRPVDVVAIFQYNHNLASHYCLFRIYYEGQYGVLYDLLNNEPIREETKTTMFDYLKSCGYISNHLQEDDIQFYGKFEKRRCNKRCKLSEFTIKWNPNSMLMSEEMSNNIQDHACSGAIVTELY